MKLNDLSVLKFKSESFSNCEVVKNKLIHVLSGRFAFVKDFYCEMQDYCDELSNAISRSYDENGGMSDSAMEIMAEFIANNYSGVSHQINYILNDRRMYKVGLDKVEFTVDLPKEKFCGLVRYLQSAPDVCVKSYSLPVHKANRIKFLHCIEVTCGVAKVVLHYQPFGRSKEQENRFAKISLNFSGKRKSGLSRIVVLLKHWFGESYYFALKNAVPTHVEMRVDFNGIHPCMLTFRGNSRSRSKSDYQPRHKRLMESAIVSSQSSKAKKAYFKTSQYASENNKNMGLIIISRFEFVAKQYNSNNKGFNGKRRYYSMNQLDCSFFYKNDHGFKFYDMNFLSDPDLGYDDFQWLVLSIVNRGFHMTYVMAQQRIRVVLDRYIVDTSKFMDDITRRFAKSLRNCKKLLCDR